MLVWKPKSSHAARQDGDWSALLAEVDALGSLSALEAWWTEFMLHRLRDLPAPFHGPLTDALDDQRETLRTRARERALDEQFRLAMERD